MRESLATCKSRTGARDAAGTTVLLSGSSLREDLGLSCAPRTLLPPARTGRDTPLWRFLVDHTISGIRGEFERYHRIAEGALTQMGDDAFFDAPDTDANSAAILVKHMAGNLKSRWTDFLTTDGEKPDRARDSEFELMAEDTRENLMTHWSVGWQLVFDELGRLNDMDLGREVYIRGQPLSVSAALLRQLAHAVYHVGQIVTLARQQAGSWQSLSVPRGGSEAFNERMRKG